MFTYLFSFFGGMNIYLAYRLTCVFKDALPFPRLLSSIWCLLATGILFFRVDGAVLPNVLTDYIYLASAYWIAIIYYAFPLTLACDIFNFIQNKLGFYIFTQPARNTAFAIMAVVALSIGYGAYHARNPLAVHYEVTVNRRAATGSMRVILVSDIHFGKIIGDGMAQKLVSEINRQTPDIVIFGGDLIDSDLESVERQDPMRFFENIKTNYGVYGIMGNHDYFSGDSRKVKDHLRSKGIYLLIDQAIELPNGVILYGRDDYRNTARKKDLAEKLAPYKEKAIIVADHQPRRIIEAQQAGADILLSGHTHKGQFFPNNFVTDRMYELDHGYKKFGGLNMIVTSGAGGWGPPVRIGSDSEVVVIDVKFK